MYREEAYEKICICWKNSLSRSPKIPNEMLSITGTNSISGRVFEDLFEADDSNEQRTSRKANDDCNNISIGGETADWCNCLTHLKETLISREVSSSHIDFLSRFKNVSCIFAPCKEESFTNVFFFEAKLPRLELGGDFRFRLTRNVLVDQSSLCVVEYGVTIMGMSGGDSKLRIRFCIVLRSKNCYNLLATADVHPPPDSWFKGQIQQALREWATSRAERAIDHDIEHPTQSGNVGVSFLSQLTKLGPLHEKLKDNILRTFVLLGLFIICTCIQAIVKFSNTTEFIPASRDELDSQFELILGKIQNVRDVELESLKTMLQNLHIQFNGI